MKEDVEFACEGFRFAGFIPMMGSIFPVLADDAPCAYGFVIFNARGGAKLVGGPSAQRGYDRARKRVGLRVLNVGRGVKS